MSFIFLNHNDKDDEESRKLVRSMATHHSHHSGARKPKESKKRRKVGGASGTGQSGPALPPSRRTSVIDTATSTSREEDVEPTSASSTQAVAPLERPPSPIGDPFDTYPVPSQPWFAQVLDYMPTCMLRGFAPMNLGHALETEALTWMQQVQLSSAPYFLMNLLTVMGDLVSRGSMPAVHIPWLTAEVVASINRALTSPATALATGTVLTVGRIAFREIMLGDMEAGVKFHRPAFARMIVLAGGLDALQQPALVRAHFFWGERLVERKTGVSIAEIEPALAEDVKNFGRGESTTDTKVFDGYRPIRNREGETQAT